MDKVKAASLLEVVVALVVILTLFGIGMMVYMNVTAGGKQGIAFRAAYLLEKEAAEIFAEESFRDEQITIDNITIFKECKPYNQTVDLMEIRLKAISADGRLLATHREIVLVEEDD